MNKKNSAIRAYAKERNVYLWEIAYKLDIADGNFSRKLRKELSPEESSKIRYLIDQIAKEKESEM